MRHLRTLPIQTSPVPATHTDSMRLLHRRRITWTPDATLEPAEEVDRLPDKPEGAVRLGHLSDFHLGKPLDRGSVPRVVGRWLADFREADVDAIVFAGDLVEVPDRRAPMLRMRRMLDRSAIPWVTVPGNHDVETPGTGPFYDLFGDYPRVERHAGIDFLLLDTMAGLPAGRRNPFERLSHLRKGYWSKGAVGPEQRRLAEGRLPAERDAPLVVLLHHHLAPQEQLLDELPESTAPPSLMVPATDAAETAEWAADLGARLLFHGHMHEFWPLYTPDPRLVAVNSGSSTRRGRARIVDLSGGKAWAYVAQLPSTTSI